MLQITHSPHSLNALRKIGRRLLAATLFWIPALGVFAEESVRPFNAMDVFDDLDFVALTNVTKGVLCGVTIPDLTRNR